MRGFSLVELMVAAGLAMVVLATGLVVGVQFQRMGSFEEQTMAAQNIQRAVRESLVMDMQRAGAGTGSGRINFGGDGSGGSDYRYAVHVETNATFSDPGFSGPTGAYAGLVSDALMFVSGNVRQMVELDACQGAGGRSRSGSNACVRTPPPPTLNGKTVVFVNPTLAVSCLHRVTHLPGDNKVQTNPGQNNNPPPSSEPCNEANGNFWSTPGGYVMEVETWGYRVNWVPHPTDATRREPVLEYDPPGSDSWQLLSRDVEQLKVRMGVSHPADPSVLLWFPDAVAGRPALDSCTDLTCGGFVDDVGDYTPLDLPAGDPERARDALMRRVRFVEVTLVTRSQRADADRVVRSGTGFAVDEEGNLRDGYRRRRMTFRVSPRNFPLAGLGSVTP
jgi:type IV pilus assembly protein PilW